MPQGKNSEKFQNRYHTGSVRLKNWDYRNPGSYFITICTKNRAPYFGEIVTGKMILSNVGIIADILWHEIKNHTKNVELGEFVVMPNHIHGILILNNDNDGVSLHENVDSLHATNLPSTNKHMSAISPKSGSLSSVVRSYKSAVTKHARRLGYHFAWQSLFYDHIIRNEKSFKQISDYISKNSQKWERDKFR